MERKQKVLTFLFMTVKRWKWHKLHSIILQSENHSDLYLISYSVIWSKRLLSVGHKSLGGNKGCGSFVAVKMIKDCVFILFCIVFLFFFLEYIWSADPCDDLPFRLVFASDKEQGTWCDSSRCAVKTGQAEREGVRQSNRDIPILQDFISLYLKKSFSQGQETGRK